MSNIDHHKAEELLLRKYAIHGLEKARDAIIDRVCGSRHSITRSCATKDFDVAAIAHLAEIEEPLAFGIWKRDYDAFSTAEIEDVRDAFLSHLEELGPKSEPDASESSLYWFLNGWS